MGDAEAVLSRDAGDYGSTMNSKVLKSLEVGLNPRASGGVTSSNRQCREGAL